MTEFNIGDNVRLKAINVMSHLEKYINRIGKVVHVETVTSPYSGIITQAAHVRFSEGERHISENSSVFELVN